MYKLQKTAIQLYWLQYLGVCSIFTFRFLWGQLLQVHDWYKLVSGLKLNLSWISKKWSNFILNLDIILLHWLSRYILGIQQICHQYKWIQGSYDYWSWLYYNDTVGHVSTTPSTLPVCSVLAERGARFHFHHKVCAVIQIVKKHTKLF